MIIVYEAIINPPLLKFDHISVVKILALENTNYEQKCFMIFANQRC